MQGALTSCFARNFAISIHNKIGKQENQPTVYLTIGGMCPDKRKRDIKRKTNNKTSDTRHISVYTTVFLRKAKNSGMSVDVDLLKTDSRGMGRVFLRRCKKPIYGHFRIVLSPSLVYFLGVFFSRNML